MSPQSPCPSCGIQGHRIDAITATAMLGDPALATAPLRFCATEGCDVVYYGDGHPASFRTRDLSVTVFQKSADPCRLVCYCFGHSVESLEREVATRGASEVPELIAQQCKAGLDDCKRKNPQGRCCLVNVRDVLRAVGSLRGPVSDREATCCASRSTSAASSARSESSSCCASTATNESE